MPETFAAQLINSFVYHFCSDRKRKVYPLSHMSIVQCIAVQCGVSLHVFDEKNASKARSPYTFTYLILDALTLPLSYVGID